MTFHEVIVDLKRRFPDAPIGETAIRGQYYDRAVGPTGAARQNTDTFLVRHDGC